MPFLADFLYYASGHAAPEPFMTWSGLSLMSAIAGRKIWTMHGEYFPIYPNLYVCLVGTPGSGKSTGMSQAEEIFTTHFKSYMVSESVMSREDMLKKMGSTECVKVWKDVKGEYGLLGALYEWRPYYCLVDEMENFVSVDASKMVATLVGIYGRNSFSTGFKNDLNPNQRIDAPYLNILACTIPEWMMSSLRQSLFVGGLGRRMIIVHATKAKDFHDPAKPANADAAMTRCVEHLRLVEKHYGKLVRTPAANAWWKDWFYSERKNKENPILLQFHETKHIQVLKVATLLALCNDPITRSIDQPHLEGAVALLDRLESDVVKLTAGVGRNELAGIAAQMLSAIESMGGAIPLKKLQLQFFRHLRPPLEFSGILEHLKATDQILVVPLLDPLKQATVDVVMLPGYYGEMKKKKPQSPTATAAA